MDNVWLNPSYEKTDAELAIFADRDGTLIKHVDYISDPEQVELLPGVRDTIQSILSQGIPFYVITNQSGVGRGYFPLDSVYACQNRLFELLGIEPSEIAGWCIAPEAPGEAGGYRKPSPRFIQEACKLSRIAQDSCHVIGDTLVDLETAWNAGAHAWAVSCGKPELPELIENKQIEGPHILRASFADCYAGIID